LDFVLSHEIFVQHHFSVSRDPPCARWTTLSSAPAISCRM
jgi:hypothetical protein